MEVDLSQPKSRNYNVLLRILQLSLAYLTTFAIHQSLHPSCQADHFMTIMFLGSALFLLSSIGILILRCSQNYSKCCMALITFLCISIMAAIVGVTAMFFNQFQNCASQQFSGLLYLFYTPFSLLTIIAIFILPFAWIQRFTNSPGNIYWALLLAIYAFPSHQSLLSISVIMILASSMLTWTSNVIAIFRGVTKGVKKLISICYWLGITTTILAQILVLFTYLSVIYIESFKGVYNQAKYQNFLLINIIDLVFWFYGFQSLDFQNGDIIRDQIIKFGKDSLFMKSKQQQQVKSF